MSTNTDRTGTVFISGRPHTIIDRASFDRLIWPHCEAELPDGAGWAVTRVGSHRFATWFEAVSEVPC